MENEEPLMATHAKQPKNSLENLKKLKTLAICVPMRGKVDCVFMQTYLSLFISLMKRNDIIVQPVFSDAMPINVARCALAREAIMMKADYILWLDSDIILKDIMIDRLWNTLHEKDEDGKERFIVSGIYYEREAPYDAVIRRKNELGRHEKIMQFPDDKPFKVDGIGFGIVLMKSLPLLEAFHASKGYPFSFDGSSEDLYFCDIVRGNHPTIKPKDIFDIHIDPSVQVPHYGSYVTQWHYLRYKLDEYADVKELALYKKSDLGDPKMYLEECFQRCSHGSLNMCRAWQEKFGKNRDENTIPEDEILEFYRNTTLYVYDLTWYWSHNRANREMIADELSGYRHNPSPRVLDFGCGNGDYGLEFIENSPSAKIDFYDINIDCLNYLKRRILIRETQNIIPKDSCKIITEGSLPTENEQYDIIFALDVLEHIKNPEKTASKLKSLLKRNGVILAQISPRGKFQPQHISQIDLTAHGFLKISQFRYVRDDSDIAKEYATHVENVEKNV
jgi:2-polyprenyl-3-methyl-5-hydroxy-6-metoxy-1,4-benzoquinol methylase